jgi:hypothetical protein
MRISPLDASHDAPIGPVYPSVPSKDTGRRTQKEDWYPGGDGPFVFSHMWRGTGLVARLFINRNPGLYMLLTDCYSMTGEAIT